MIFKTEFISLESLRCCVALVAYKNIIILYFIPNELSWLKRTRRFQITIGLSNVWTKIFLVAGLLVIFAMCFFHGSDVIHSVSWIQMGFLKCCAVIKDAFSDLVALDQYQTKCLINSLLIMLKSFSHGVVWLLTTMMSTKHITQKKKNVRCLSYADIR